MGGAGIEPVRENPRKMPQIDPCGAESGARLSHLIISDPELARVVGAWSHLPAAVRRGIVAMVNAGWDDSHEH
jgi:hypothetical protein